MNFKENIIEYTQPLLTGYPCYEGFFFLAKPKDKDR